MKLKVMTYNTVTNQSAMIDYNADSLREVHEHLDKGPVTVLAIRRVLPVEHAKDEETEQPVTLKQKFIAMCLRTQEW